MSTSGANARIAKGSTHDMSEIHPNRLFFGSCLALAATAIGFAVTADIMGVLKAQFLLSNFQAGFIMGAWLYGFTFSILIFGPFVDATGMRFQIRLALACHIIGALIFMSATFVREIAGAGFWVLLVGTFILSMGNGLVEAVGNPMVATVYPDRKTQKLNQFHMWFPGGIFIGGLLCYFMNKVGLDTWQLKMCLILLPAIAYGFVFLGQKFPLTERVQSGLSFGDMMKATFGRPLFLILLLCMGITASLELGPNRWIPSVYAAVAIPGILMLAWINGLMAVMRSLAGHAVERLAPSGMLVVCAIISLIGLFLLSMAETKVMAFAAATVFALGVCYFWPTMLGVTSERVPKGGALALALMGGFGNLIVGLVATPLMGNVADHYIVENLPVEDTRAALQSVLDTYPAPPADKKATLYNDTEKAHVDAKQAMDAFTGDQPSDDAKILAAAALRSASQAQPIGFSPEDEAKIKEVGAAAGAVIGPMDNQGGRRSFRYLAPFALILIAVFGTVFLKDKAQGGYRAERLDIDSTATAK